MQSWSIVNIFSLFSGADSCNPNNNKKEILQSGILRVRNGGDKLDGRQYCDRSSVVTHTLKQKVVLKIRQICRILPSSI